MFWKLNFVFLGIVIELLWQQEIDHCNIELHNGIIQLESIQKGQEVNLFFGCIIRIDGLMENLFC